MIPFKKNILLLFYFFLISIGFSQNKIPEDYKKDYQSKDYNYEIDPTFLDNLKEWFSNLAHTFLNYLGANSKNIAYYKYTFYTIIAVLTTYIIAKMFLHKEGQWIFKKKRNNNKLMYSQETEAIETTNFEILLQETIVQKKYRLAVKYYYLWSLQQLANKELITLNNLKTNTDYQVEIEETKYFNNFKNTSYYYNYVWYGEFEIDENEFERIEISFKNFLKSISHG